MIWAFLGVLIVAEAAKLDNTYLPPPPGAKESGGSDGALQLPLEPPYVDPYTPATEPSQAWRPGTRSLSNRGKTTKPEDGSFLENEEEITVPALEKGRFISGSYSYTGPDNVLVTVTYKADDRKGRKGEDAQEEDDQRAEDDEHEEEEGRDLNDDDDEEEEEDSIVPTPPSLPSELARAFDFHKKKHQAQEGKTNRPKKPIRKNHKNRGQHGHHGEDSDGQYGQKAPLHHGQGQKTPLHHGQGLHGGQNQNSASSGYHYTPQYSPGNQNQYYPSEQKGDQYSPQNQYYPSEQKGNHYPQNQYEPTKVPTIHQGYSSPKHS